MMYLDMSLRRHISNFKEYKPYVVKKKRGQLVINERCMINFYKNSEINRHGFLEFMDIADSIFSDVADLAKVLKGEEYRIRVDTMSQMELNSILHKKCTGCSLTLEEDLKVLLNCVGLFNAVLKKVIEEKGIFSDIAYSAMLDALDIANNVLERTHNELS